MIQIKSCTSMEFRTVVLFFIVKGKIGVDFLDWKYYLATFAPKKRLLIKSCSKLSFKYKQRYMFASFRITNANSFRTGCTPKSSKLTYDLLVYHAVPLVMLTFDFVNKR